MDESEKTITCVVVEHIGESNNWEWYSIARNITPDQAIQEYCTAMEVPCGTITRNNQSGYYYANDYDDVRAITIEI